MAQRVVFVNFEIDHEAHDVGPKKLDASDEENSMETRHEHEVEELRRRPQDGAVQVRRQKFGLELFKDIRFGFDDGHGDEEGGDGNRETHLIQKHFLGDAFKRSPADEFIEECVPVMIESPDDSPAHQARGRHALAVDRKTRPITIF